MTDFRDGSVQLEIDGPIARVWLNRPDKLNAIHLDLLAGLIDAAREIKKNREVRAVVLQGRGTSFSAGLDFPTVGKSPARILRFFIPNPLKGTNVFQEALWVWRELPVPVIAVTSGHVFGGGIQLALAADFRFTTPDCQWSVLEAKWGLVPDMSGTVPLSELVPADLAKRLVITGEVFSGAQAVEWGIASGVDENPSKLAEELIAQIIARSPDSVAASKKLLNSAAWGGIRAQFGRERRYQLAMFRTKNASEARRAGAKKQEPNFGPRTFG